MNTKFQKDQEETYKEDLDSLFYTNAKRPRNHYRNNPNLDENLKEWLSYFDRHLIVSLEKPND